MTDSRFFGTLKAEKIGEAKSAGRAKWKLTAPLDFYSNRLLTLITVPEGFETDFSSVPRLPFAYFLAGDTAHASAVMHDYLARISYPRGVITWAEAANVFGDAMAVEGVPKWRRYLMVSAVKLAGVFK